MENRGSYLIICAILHNEGIYRCDMVNLQVYPLRSDHFTEGRMKDIGDIISTPMIWIDRCNFLRRKEDAWGATFLANASTVCRESSIWNLSYFRQ